MNIFVPLRHAFSLLLVDLLLLAACSSGSGSTTTVTPPSPPPTQTVHSICANIISTNGSGANGDPIGNADCAFGWTNGPPISTCLGSPQCSGQVGGVAYDSPFTITMSIISGFATPLTATLVNCPLGPQSQTSPCVAATNESGANAFTVHISFGQPNGNVGPSTTLILQQTGTSALTDAGGDCNHLSWANATDILVADTYGNKVYLPILQTLDGSGCTHGTT